MSVGKTTKVAASTPGIKRVGQHYGNSGSDIEKIDTTNNVLIKDDDNNSGQKRGQDNPQKKDDNSFVSESINITNAINVQGIDNQSTRKNSEKATEAYEKTDHLEDQEDFDELV